MLPPLVVAVGLPDVPGTVGFPPGMYSALPDLLRVMTDPGEEAARMRQSGPFAGVLTAQERKAIKEKLKAQWLRHGTL